MKSIILIFKGFLMGIANVIPGVSGGTIAIILGFYEQFISAISHLFKNLKENLKFLIPIMIGMVLSILILSGVIEYSYDNYPLPTMMFFVGLVLGGIPMLMKNVINKKECKQVSSYIVALLAFLLVMVIAASDLIFGTTLVVNLSNMEIFDYILLFSVGVIAAATMVMPGISGSLVLMLLGYYYPVISTINSLLTFDNLIGDVLILGTFGLGILVGIVLISKLLEMLFKKYKTKTYFAVLGFIFASVLAIPLSTCLEVENLTMSMSHIIASLILLAGGATMSYKLGEKD